jgi:hypothetical protein
MEATFIDQEVPMTTAMTITWEDLDRTAPTGLDHAPQRPTVVPTDLGHAGEMTNIALPS